MSALATFLTALLVMPALVVKADNCTFQAMNDVLQLVAADPNYATCQSDSNYTLLSFATPSIGQTRGFCSSPACQALLNATLGSGRLPECEVVIGAHTFNLTDAVASVASKCGSARDKLSLDERVVDKSDIQSRTQRASDHVASALGHSAPMDEVGGIGGLAGALLTLLRR